MFSSKPFLAIFFLSCLVWGASIFIAGEPMKRIDRTCAPVGWTNTFVGSLTSLVAPSYTPKVNGFFDRRFMDCRFLVWQQFYETDYLEMKAQEAMPAGEAK